METGICRRCGCNWITPCIDEKYGPCWWVDKNRTLCSHCFYGFNDEPYQVGKIIKSHTCQDFLQDQTSDLENRHKPQKNLR